MTASKPCGLPSKIQSQFRQLQETHFKTKSNRRVGVTSSVCFFKHVRDPGVDLLNHNKQYIEMSLAVQ